MHYHKLDFWIKNDQFPMHLMDEIFDQLVESGWSCFLDWYLSCNEICISLEDQDRTTFTCPYGTFSLKGMTYGLCNEPATLQRCVLSIFSKIVQEKMEFFMDDFTLVGDSLESFLDHLSKVLEWGVETNLVLNWEKCHFMIKEGIVLGHKILHNGIPFDHEKVNMIPI